MNIVFSPCPNDTFIFHAWVHGLLADAPQVNVTYADIDVTNRLVTQPDGPDVVKISYAALPYLHTDYQLLHCGGALGYGCGPLLVCRPDLSGHPADAEQSDVSRFAWLNGKRIGIPSDRSTAYLLFRLWLNEVLPEGQVQITVMPFETIMPAVAEGMVDAGLVIHEARFTYQAHGLALLTDLGVWWEGDSGLPIPLGAIVAKRTLDRNLLEGWIRRSVENAWQDEDASMNYILEHAQEMNPQVARQHIALYVNQESAQLSVRGKQAIRKLFNRACAAGLLPEVDWSIHHLQDVPEC